jgi:hypothetical protein
MRTKPFPSLNQETANTGLTAACVFGISACVYLLSFSGLPISDDEELFASAARNLAILGTLSAGQLSGSARLAGSYHGVEPAFPALASIWYRLFLHTDVGHLQTLYLLPILCTAVSAALMVILAAQLGFSDTLGAVTALLYAFGSMAWPYAKTLLREPLLALLLLGSLSIYLWLSRKRRPWASILMGTLLAALLVLLVLTRVVMVVAGLALLIALPFVHPALRGKHPRWAAIAVLGAAGLLAIGLAVGTLRATDADAFYRFTGAFVKAALTRLNAIPHSHLEEALLAPLISPWKGLLFFSPACLIGLFSLGASARRQPALALLACSVLIALLLVQALAYDDRWWTPTWGSRFLIPVVPLLILAALPFLERLAEWGKRGWIAIGGLFAVSALAQLPAVLFNSAEFTAATYESTKGAFPQALIWNIARTPVLTQWQAAASQAPDLLLWRMASAQPVLAFAICVIALSGAILGFMILRRMLLDSGSRPGLLPICLAVLIPLLTVLLLNASVHDPAYETRAFEPVCTYIHDHIQANDVLIVEPYPGPVWQYLMNTECGQRAWYSLPYHAQPGSARELIPEVPAGARYWLIQQFWSESFRLEDSSLASLGDPVMHQQVFYLPYHLFLAGYRRGVAK